MSDAVSSETQIIGSEKSTSGVEDQKQMAEEISTKMNLVIGLLNSVIEGNTSDVSKIVQNVKEAMKHLLATEELHRQEYEAIVTELQTLRKKILQKEKDARRKRKLSVASNNGQHHIEQATDVTDLNDGSVGEEVQTTDPPVKKPAIPKREKSAATPTTTPSVNGQSGVSSKPSTTPKMMDPAAEVERLLRLLGK
jgi:uncharacterized protein YfkK (UPF0435 family)